MLISDNINIKSKRANFIILNAGDFDKQKFFTLNTRLYSYVLYVKSDQQYYYAN